MVKKLRQIKVVLMASIIIAICGNVTYMAAQKADSVVLMILGRALAGFGAGEKAIYLFILLGGVVGVSLPVKKGIARATCSLSFFCVLVGFVVDI